MEQNPPLEVDTYSASGEVPGVLGARRPSIVFIGARTLS
jgi:hypothetical protein